MMLTDGHSSSPVDPPDHEDPSQIPGLTIPVSPEKPGRSKPHLFPTFDVDLPGGRIEKSLTLWALLDFCGRLQMVPMAVCPHRSGGTLLGFVQGAGPDPELIYRNPDLLVFDYVKKDTTAPLVVGGQAIPALPIGKLHEKVVLQSITKSNFFAGERMPRTTYPSSGIIPGSEYFAMPVRIRPDGHSLYYWLVYLNRYGNGLTLEEEALLIAPLLQRDFWARGIKIPVAESSSWNQVSSRLIRGKLTSARSGWLDEIPFRSNRFIINLSKQYRFTNTFGEVMKVQLNPLVQLQLALVFEPNNERLFWQIVDTQYPHIARDGTYSLRRIPITDPAPPAK
jgi:hypothetical protein